MKIRNIITVCLLWFTALACNAKTEMGVNFNGALDLPRDKEISETKADWIRGFYRFFDFYSGKKNMNSDQGLKNFRNLARKSKYKTILSIRWDFKHENISIPENGSQRMKDYIAHVEKLLNYMGKDIEKFVISNEPMWETKSSDRRFNSTKGFNPSVVFFKRIANIANNWKKRNNARFDIYVGAFNKLAEYKNHSSDDVVKMISFARNTGWIKGIDLHTHAKDINEYERDLIKARDMLGYRKDIIVTEHSLVWRWKQNVGKKLPSGFTSRYNYNRNWKYVDYFNHARRNKVNKGEWNNLFNRTGWWVKDYFSQAQRIFDRYDVSVSNYGMKLYPIERTIQKNEVPWYLNALYQTNFLKPVNNGLQPHAFIYDNFQRAQ